MFRAISDYDGSDTSKCISLCTGDVLSEVHELDETWFIGYNERTKETGAFPISCVQPITANLYTPVSAKGKDTKREDDGYIYANVSKQIQAGTVADDLDPIERTRTLSNHAKTFDAERLKSVRNRTGAENKADRYEETGMELRDHTQKSDDSNHYQSTTKKSVHFENNQLQHSVSVPESVLSWQDSSFEQSLDDRVMAKTSDGNKNGFEIAEKELDGKYHKLRAIKSTTERIFNSAKNEQKVSKALFGALAGFVIGGLLYLVLVFSYGYSYLVAGIIDAVATVFFILCLAFCPLCRCVMALVFPNFFTGKGRAVFLSIIFGVMLSHPIANISLNIQEASKSMACVTELAANQTRALQKQFAQPVSEVTTYVENEKDNLKVIYSSMKLSFSGIETALEELDKQVDTAKKAVLSVKEECRRPFIEGRNKCVQECNAILKLLNEPCTQACTKIQALAVACDSLDETGALITESARKTRAEVQKGIRYFDVDLEVSSKVEGSVNESKSFEGIQEELEKEVGHVFLSFKTAVFVFKIILSLSLGLIFFQSFWYLRNYLAKDAYDNIYITSQFKKLDKENAEKGMEAILPLKKKERSIYVDTSSFKLNATELVHCRLGLAQVFLHFILCVMVVLFDYSLYFILRLIEKNGNIQIEVEGEGRFTVQVKGHGPVAEFYRIMVQGFNLDQTYSSSLDVGNCLPRPGQPSGAILLSLVLLYLIALTFVVLRGYGMRLRRKIAAYYYPEQERMRLEYLHKKIRHKRIGFLKFLRQQIQSAQKENDVKQRFRISAWLAFKFPAFERFFPSHDKLECTSCEQKESSFHGIVLTKCPGQTGGMPCDAVYCQECKSALNEVCPLCSQDAVVLRT